MFPTVQGVALQQTTVDQTCPDASQFTSTKGTVGLAATSGLVASEEGRGGGPPFALKHRVVLT